MTPEEEAHAQEDIRRANREADRLRTLSNKQLVREVLNHADYNEVEWHIEEMANRLYPEWAGPLSWKERLSFQWLRFRRLMKIGRGL